MAALLALDQMLEPFLSLRDSNVLIVHFHATRYARRRRRMKEDVEEQIGPMGVEELKNLLDEISEEGETCEFAIKLSITN